MAQTTTLTIKSGGVPLVNAEVISSDALSTIATTDADGKITASLPDDYAATVLVAVRHSSIPDTTYVAVCILESGQDYEINLPNSITDITEGVHELLGIHAHLARKL